MVLHPEAALVVVVVKVGDTTEEVLGVVFKIRLVAALVVVVVIVVGNVLLPLLQDSLSC